MRPVESIVCEATELRKTRATPRTGAFSESLDIRARNPVARPSSAERRNNITRGKGASTGLAGMIPHAGAV